MAPAMLTAKKGLDKLFDVMVGASDSGNDSKSYIDGGKPITTEDLVKMSGEERMNLYNKITTEVMSEYFKSTRSS